MQGVPSALKKTGTEACFYALYAAGQCRLGNPQLIGRSANPTVIHHGEEAADIFNIQACSASLFVIFHILHMQCHKAG